MYNKLFFIMLIYYKFQQALVLIHSLYLSSINSIGLNYNSSIVLSNNEIASESSTEWNLSWYNPCKNISKAGTISKKIMLCNNISSPANHKDWNPIAYEWENPNNIWMLILFEDADCIGNNHTVIQNGKYNMPLFNISSFSVKSISE